MSSAHRAAAVAAPNEGFVTNILNPAIATFSLVLLPQFIPPVLALAITIALG